MQRNESAAQMDRAQDSLYGVEHSAAWLMALGAIVLGIIGALTGLGVIDLRDTANANVLPGIDVSGSDTTPGVFSNNFWDGAMLLFSAMTAAVLAYCLHASDHHRGRDLSTLPNSERGLWSGEHTGAYLFAVAAITLVVIGLLTGFGAFGDQDQTDGLMWIWLGLTSSFVATTLHAVRHHQAVADEDMIIAIVEDRVNARAGSVQPGRQPM
jgi:hypothetical protein